MNVVSSGQQLHTQPGGQSHEQQQQKPFFHSLSGKFDAQLHGCGSSGCKRLGKTAGHVCWFNYHYLIISYVCHTLRPCLWRHWYWPLRGGGKRRKKRRRGEKKAALLGSQLLGLHRYVNSSRAGPNRYVNSNRAGLHRYVNSSHAPHPHPPLH